jgi:hypothetical protein
MSENETAAGIAPAAIPRRVANVMIVGKGPVPVAGNYQVFVGAERMLGVQSIHLEIDTNCAVQAVIRVIPDSVSVAGFDATVGPALCDEGQALALLAERVGALTLEMADVNAAIRWRTEALALERGGVGSGALTADVPRGSLGADGHER